VEDGGPFSAEDEARLRRMNTGLLLALLSCMLAWAVVIVMVLLLSGLL
jgi:hypothetical protein